MGGGIAGLQVADGLYIIPDWSEPVDTAATNIILTPGVAFGTGAHKAGPGTAGHSLVMCQPCYVSCHGSACSRTLSFPDSSNPAS